MAGADSSAIPRVDPTARAAGWKRAMLRMVATKPGAAVHRTLAARLDAPLMRVSGGRVSLAAGAIPLVVLTATGARSGRPRDVPLVYFSDGDDVILMASSYGRARHPSWYYNLKAHPECELRVGRRSGRYAAREVEGEERDRLYALAVQHYAGYAGYADWTAGIRTIPVLRLTAVG